MVTSEEKAVLMPRLWRAGARSTTEWADRVGTDRSRDWETNDLRVDNLF